MRVQHVGGPEDLPGMHVTPRREPAQGGHMPARRRGSWWCRSAVVVVAAGLSSMPGCGDRSAEGEASQAPVEPPQLPPLSCAEGQADCDGDRDNGCEVDLGSDPARCGGCMIACAPGQGCGGGLCRGREPTGLAGGERFSCAVVRDGRVACWGDDASGQLGGGAERRAPGPVLVSGLSSVVEIAAGSAHACGRAARGPVRCWGENGGGQVGDGTRVDRDAPVEVTGIADVVQLAAGRAHTCARLRDGEAWCWGGAAGPTATAVRGIEGALQLAAGGGHTCALDARGSVRCWSATGSSPAAPVTGIDGAVEIAVGTDLACARLEGGAVKCWTPGAAGAPAATDGIEGAKGLFARGAGMCAVDGERVTRCWNPGSFVAIDPRYGEGTPMGSFGRHACAMDRSGAITCWGDNRHGQLGDGTRRSRDQPAAIVAPD